MPSDNSLPPASETAQSGSAPKRLPSAELGVGSNPLASLIFNIALPSIVLFKFSGPERLGPLWALVAALAFPIGYGLYDLLLNRRRNIISLLGFASFCLTGLFGFFKLNGTWFAVKEALIPALIGYALVYSLKTKLPLVRAILYNEKMINVTRVDAALAINGSEKPFEQLLVTTTYILASSFLLSSVLHFILAMAILKSVSGTPEFNQELAKVTALSYPVIAVPCMVITMIALWRLLSGIKKLTGLELDVVFAPAPPPASTLPVQK